MAEIKIEKKKPIWPWLLGGLAVIALIAILWINSGDEESEYAGTVDTTETQGWQDGESEGQAYGEGGQQYGEGGQQNGEGGDMIDVKENNSTVTDFVNFVQQNGAQMGRDHELTNSALLKLSEATKAIASETNYDISREMAKVNQAANMITEDPTVTKHANKIRNSADILTDVLANIQQQKYPSLNNEIQDLKNASTAIKPDVETLNQKEEVKGFLDRAAGLLAKMN